MEDLLGGGIKRTQIDNYENYKDVIGNMICCVCLHVVFNPVECYKCETVICEDCQQIILIAGRKCVTNKCEGNFRKANKFVREVLSNLIITCDWCNKKGILYKDHSKHLEICEGYLSSTRNQLFRTLTEKDEKAMELQKEVDNLKRTIKMTTPLKTRDPYSGMSKETLRNSLMTFSLSVTQKMELYNSCVDGKLNDFKNLVLNKKYPVLEEVSAHGYYWTPLHYGMHYGQFEIVKFISEILKKNNQLDAAMRLESNDNRCPILCLLRSNSLTLERKKELLIQFLMLYPNISLSTDVKKEARARDMEGIIKKYSKAA
jgi:hypothetical protein